MDGVLDAIDAGRRIEVTGGGVEGAMREIGVDPESALEVCVELEDSADSADSRGEVWRVYALKEELSGLAGTLVGEGGVVVGSTVAVVGSKALELERELRAKDLVRIEFVVVAEGDAEGEERLVVWVKERSPLWHNLVELIAGVLKQKKEAETEGPMAPMAPMETEGLTAPMETEPMAPKKKDTEVANEKKEPMETQEKKETEVPKKMETEVPKKAEKAALLRAKAREAAEAAAKAASAAAEAEEEAEEEAAAEREAEREETKRALERARQTLDRARDEVEGLERQLAQQIDVERRKRKRMNQGESPSRRVSARKEKEEIVIVDDREFEEAMGGHGGAVRRVWVERFEGRGPRGTGPVRGGDMVLESVYCSGTEAAEAAEALFAASTGADGEVVVKGFTAVRQYDAWMEKNEFVKRTIDVENRCMNPGSPAEPVSGEDTERVWVKRGSAELAALDKLIAKALERARKWQWQCPESPRSPVYYAYAPSPVDDDHEDERNVVD